VGVGDLELELPNGSERTKNYLHESCSRTWFSLYPHFNQQT
jgi:hypothetical protein